MPGPKISRDPAYLALPESLPGMGLVRGKPFSRTLLSSPFPCEVPQEDREACSSGNPLSTTLQPDSLEAAELDNASQAQIPWKWSQYCLP